MSRVHFYWGSRSISLTSVIFSRNWYRKYICTTKMLLSLDVLGARSILWPKPTSKTTLAYNLQICKPIAPDSHQPAENRSWKSIVSSYLMLKNIWQTRTTTSKLLPNSWSIPLLLRSIVYPIFSKPEISWVILVTPQCFRQIFVHVFAFTCVWDYFAFTIPAGQLGGGSLRLR